MITIPTDKGLMSCLKISVPAIYGAGDYIAIPVYTICSDVSMQEVEAKIAEDVNAVQMARTQPNGAIPVMVVVVSEKSENGFYSKEVGIFAIGD
jgi:hypothetical protein